MRAQPSAEIRVVEVEKLRTFYDFCGPRATVCGDRARRSALAVAPFKFVLVSANPLRSSFFALQSACSLVQHIGSCAIGFHNKSLAKLPGLGCHGPSASPSCHGGACGPMGEGGAREQKLVLRCGGKPTFRPTVKSIALHHELFKAVVAWMATTDIAPLQKELQLYLGMVNFQAGPDQIYRESWGTAFGSCLVVCAPAFAIPRSRVRFPPGPRQLRLKIAA